MEDLKQNRFSFEFLNEQKKIVLSKTWLNRYNIDNMIEAELSDNI